MRVNDIATNPERSEQTQVSSLTLTQVSSKPYYYYTIRSHMHGKMIDRHFIIHDRTRIEYLRQCEEPENFTLINKLRTVSVRKLKADDSI